MRKPPVPMSVSPNRRRIDLPNEAAVKTVYEYPGCETKPALVRSTYPRFEHLHTRPAEPKV